MVATGEGPTIHLERYFYVEHSFNSMQTLTWALAYEDATMIFSTTRVSTDEVLGVGSQLKRSVGRGQVRTRCAPGWNGSARRTPGDPC